ncbi:MAG: hypothetical protein AAF546_01105 [Verrucomicrobiota bacterium]
MTKLPKLFKNLCFLSLVSGAGSFAQSAEAQTACATVKIVIEQQVTLERQAFEATLTVNNGLASPLDSFTVEVWVKELDSGTFLTRQEVNELDFFQGDIGDGAKELLFFKPIDPPSEDAITISSGQEETFLYRLIPTQDATLTEEGTRYEVGANISYLVDGVDEAIEVEPDSILVKPLPGLTLEYFLPKSVIADNPNTAVTESSEPFDLGVRVVNSGVGSAQNLKIESFQPRIEENAQGLLVDFRILGSQVNGAEALPSLTANFGELLPGHAETASWQMLSTVFGRFIEARASFTHSDELGGEITSVIEDTSVYRLIGTVEANGDGIPDFLSFGGETAGDFYLDNAFTEKLIGGSETELLTLHPSGLQGDGSPGAIATSGVANLSNFVTPTVLNGSQFTVTISGIPAGQAGANYSFFRIPDQRLGRYTIHSVQRGDASFIPSENFSLSTELAENSDGTINESADFEYYIDVFDIGNVSGSETYTINYGDLIATNTAPVIIPLPELPLIEKDEAIQFTVEAFDLDGDPVDFIDWSIPSGATFTPDASNQDPSRAVYNFDWIAQEGDSVFSVVASDGVNSTSASMTINVLSNVDLDAWLEQYGLTELDLDKDHDYDGYTTLLEYVLNLDPTEKSTEGLPRVFVYEDGNDSYLALECEVLSQVLLSGSVVDLSVEVANDSQFIAGEPEINSYSELSTTTPGMKRVFWVDNTAISDGTSGGRNSRFIRLKAVYTPPSTP